MSRVIRLFFVLLLVAALPVRGVAGATMLFCLESGSAMSADHGAAHAAPADDHAMHDMEGHAHAAHHAAPSDTDTGSNAPQGTDEPHHAGCGTSGACCTGVATGPLFPQPATREPLTTSIPFHAPLYAGVELEHAERPPLA